jgi:hypothetical protein
VPAWINGIFFRFSLAMCPARVQAIRVKSPLRMRHLPHRVSNKQKFFNKRF